MNKLLLFVLIVFLSLFVANAQDSRYGIRVGANLSSISSDDIEEDAEDARIGVAVGFFAEYYVTNHISIQPELQFSSQGNKAEDLRVNYIQLPVIFKYNFNQVINLQLGPQAGLKIWEWEDNGLREANFNTINFAAVGGLGFNITDNFYIDARYEYGINNLYEQEGIQREFKGNLTNIQLSIGYRL
ncbi:PorT family protein [Aquimarina sp. ERC-38]|uniref:porin family protein n=1 Tax=Aquimarina sp. ERC-38 TaxID=2949996 RepID=UPI002245C9E2|nr:porin family protein [Aquimarina sp. ERC-38]UZO80255.1 PorT family protein [Aquimarina sp. ERC-38]